MNGRPEKDRATDDPTGLRFDLWQDRPAGHLGWVSSSPCASCSIVFTVRDDTGPLRCWTTQPPAKARERRVSAVNRNVEVGGNREGIRRATRSERKRVCGAGWSR